MKPINYSKVAEACDFIQRHTIFHAGYMHSSVRAFDALMRSFDCTLPAEAVTFRIFLNAPVMAPGEITVHRDGSYEVRRA